MRIMLNQVSRGLLADKLLSIYNLSELAKLCNVSRNTIKSYFFTNQTISQNKFISILKLANLSESELVYKTVSDYWYVYKAAKMGGQARIKKVGNPGTSEGRKLGGLRSIKKQLITNSKFKRLKKIKEAVKSVMLAELLGIMMGDGHLSFYQVSMVTNSETDYEHALYVSKIFEKLFSVKPSIRKKNKEKAVEIVVSSKRLVQYFEKLGMPQGNKIRKGLSVPKWITRNTDYSKAFIRGLFDTDGCVYVDRHRYNGKSYKHFGWTITSYADKFIDEIKNLLQRMGFRPTNTIGQKSVYIRRQSEVKRYFEEIGTNNPKHRNRFLKL